MKNIVLNGQTYRLEPMRADEAAELGLHVLSIAGGPLQAIIGSMDDDVKNALTNFEEGKEVDGDVLMTVAATFLSVLPQMNMQKVSAVLKKALMESISCEAINGGSGKMDQEHVRTLHFQQFPQNYYAIAIWAVWENCRDFLIGAVPGLKTVFLGSADATLSPLTSQKTEASNGSLPAYMKPGSAPMQTLKNDG